MEIVSSLSELPGSSECRLCSLEVSQPDLRMGLHLESVCAYPVKPEASCVRDLAIRQGMGVCVPRCEVECGAV